MLTEPPPGMSMPDVGGRSALGAGCGCAQTAPVAGWWLLLTAIWPPRRRARA
jgi:hypothetical protein